ncbi:MAG: LPS assembly protein LptD [Methylomicrobium sp.]|nr:LPS assembly protein LptD [Methylomicrobium sp.]
MHFRFFLYLFFFAAAKTVLADDAIWDCEKTSESEEWECVTEKPAATPVVTPPPVQAKPVPPISEQRPIDKVPEQPEDSDIESAEAPEIKTLPPESFSEEADGVASTDIDQPDQKLADETQAELLSEPVAEEKAKPEKPPVMVNYTGAKPKATSQSVSATDQKGWNCDVKADNDNWNCKLSGTDPRGKPRVMEDSDAGFTLLTPTFDHDQEQTFDVLQSRLSYDPWATCTTSLGMPPDFKSSKDLREKTPMEVNADYSEIFDNEVTGFFGSVDVARADQRLTADTVHYDTVSQTMDAQGHSFYSEDELSLYSESMMLKLGSDEARLRNAQFISPSTPIRGAAKAVYRDSKFLSRFTDVAFTSCAPGNQDWVMHASNLKLNKETGEGSAKNAWLEFKGVPFIYTPYISFPIDNRRKSGFLSPNLSFNDRNGYDVSAPYYFNIAPDYDATFRPRYISERGMMIGGDARYLSRISQSELSLDVLTTDALRNDETRFQGAFRNNVTFMPNLISTIDANYVSDDDYIDDMGNTINFNDTRFLRSHGDVRYNLPGVSFFSQLENYQTIDKTILPEQEPYRRLPQTRLDLDHSFDFMPLDVAMGSEFVYFQHDEIVDGARFNVKPSVSMPLATPGTFLTPKFSLQHTQYSLNNQAVGKSDSISRTLPILSLDSGAIMERDLNLGQSAYTHTLEPRLFYLYIPNTDQDDIPIFDSAEYDFNFNSMFRENRFSGEDRVQDANQITTALTTRLIDQKTGREQLKLSVGEIFYFQDRRVDIPTSEILRNQSIAGAQVQAPQPLDTSLSNLVTEFNAQLTDHLKLVTALQWDHYQNDITRSEVALRYNNRTDQIVNLGYRYRQDLLEQTDVSIRWPIVNNWYVVGRWQYSMLFNSTVESFAGFEKESCCWRFRIIGRRYINAINDLRFAEQAYTGESQTGVFVQLELKGLSSFGTSLDTFFERNIYGYRKPQ